MNSRFQMFQRLLWVPFPELTSTGAGSFGGSSFVTKVRDTFAKAFVRTGGWGAGGAVYESFWTTLVSGTVLDKENLLLLTPVYRQKKESISELQPTKAITFLQAPPPEYYQYALRTAYPSQCQNHYSAGDFQKSLRKKKKLAKVSGHKHKKVCLSRKSTSLISTFWFHTLLKWTLTMWSEFEKLLSSKDFQVLYEVFTKTAH